MPEAGQPRRRRRWPWIVAAVVLAAFLLRGPLLAPVVTRVVASQLAQAIDGEARMAFAGGGWFGDARLGGISAQAPLGVLRELRIDALEAGYGLRLFTGDLTALRSLTVDNLRATIDLRGGDGDDSDGVIPPLLELLPQPLPQATLTGAVHLLLPGREVRLSAIDLRLQGDQVTLAVQVHIGDAAPLALAARFRRPTADTLRLEEAVVLGDATVEALEVVLGRARQQVIGMVQVGGGRLNLHADPVSARVAAEGLDLAAIPPVLAALLPENTGALGGLVAGEATAGRSPQGWRIAGSLRLQDLVVAGCGPFSVQGDWRLGDDTVHVPRLAITGPAAGSALIEGLVLALADGRPRAGTIRATIPQVRGWVPAHLPVPEVPLALAADLAVEGDTLAIHQARLTGGGVDLAVQGSMAAAPWRIEAAAITARVDLARLAGWLPLTTNLAGEVRLGLSGTLPLNSAWETWLQSPLDLQVRSEAVVVSALTLDQVRIDARTGDGRVHLLHASGALAGIAAEMTGEAAWERRAWRGSVATLSVAFPGVTVSAGAPCPLIIAADAWSLGPLQLASPAGAVRIEARHHAGAGLVTVEAPRVDLDRLGVAGLGGTVAVGLDLNGEWSRPQGQVRVVGEDLRIGDRRAQMNLHLVQDQHGIAVRSGRIAAGEDGGLVLSGTLPLVVGAAGATPVPDDGLPAAVDLVVPALERWSPFIAAGSTHLRLRLGGPQDAHLVSGRWSFAGVQPRPLVDDQVRARGRVLSIFDGGCDVRGTVDGVELDIAVRADGAPVLTGALRSPGAWDRSLLAGGWRVRTFNGEADLAGMELARLAAVVPAVQHLLGKVSGHLAVGGTFQEPSWHGHLALSEVEAKLATDVPTLAEGSARVAFAGRRMQVEDGRFSLGGATMAVSGTVRLDDPPVLDLRLDGRNALLVQRHDARVRADLGLTLSGPLDRATLAGRAVVTSAVFSPDISLWQGGGGGRGDGRLVPFEFITPPLSTLRFDVAVSSAFTSPQDGVRVATSLVRADCDLDLHLRGNGAAPELAGRVVVRRGHVFLPFSTLQLSTGEVLFPEGDPFHPRLTAVATAQVRRWRLTLQADGLLADPQIRASGDGLDERDALLLLTAGATSEELSGDEGQRAALGRLGTWLGREAWGLIDGTEDPDADPSLMDRLTLEFGRQVSDSGKDTIEAQVEVTAPEVNPGVLLYGERDRWDDYNAGVILRFRWGGEE